MGEICNLIAAAYPDENWKSAITLNHIADQMRDLRLVFQNTPTHFSGRYNEDNCEGFLVELFTDTRTEAELEAHELKISIDSAIGMFSNFGTVGELYTIVIQDQPSTNE